jgi:hypothetical protein
VKKTENVYIASQCFVSSSTSLNLSSRKTIVQRMERYSWIISCKKTFILELEGNRSRFDRWFTIIESKFSN